MKATGGTIGDVASGFRQVAQKTAEMAEEAAGRATETARGMFTSSEKGHIETNVSIKFANCLLKKCIHC